LTDEWSILGEIARCNVAKHGLIFTDVKTTGNERNMAAFSRKLDRGAEVRG
jgi:uncharacterized DUF497 family protein